MIISTLERDLANRVTARHIQWIKDSLELYRMADEDHKRAAFAIVSTLIDSLAGAAIAYGMSVEDMCHFVTKAMIRIKKESDE